ncbi:MAG: peroxiredoxin [Myxococcales bacterium]|nr:peroxiredoxin [Myxococcales bacterium]|tara:strand:- start:18 stop:488 length:471 start_codon:yes stop_codon:yes gene_type:complete
MSLDVGTPAPAFRLEADDGAHYDLAELRGKQVVLFFYPKASTPGCTTESIDFTERQEAFQAANTVVLGCSRDSIQAQCRFRDKYDLGVPLLSDPDHETHEAYGAWGMKKMYGRESIGCIRTTVLIDKRGQVAEVWSKVRVRDHAQKVLEAAEALNA